MMTLIDCSGCRTPLQLPQGARCIRCAICGAVTHVATPPAPGPSRGSRATPPAPGPSRGSRATPPAPAAPGPSRGSRVMMSRGRPASAAPSAAPTPMPPRPLSVAPAAAWGPPPRPAHRYSRHELMGCINDASIMLNGYDSDDHTSEDAGQDQYPQDLVQEEEQTDPYKIPTKYNIRMAMYWLVQGCQPGDSLVFHYSGHGAQQRNFSGDEVVGFVETHQTIFPLDFETQGMIVDDEINTELVRPLPHGVKLHALIDACHSGTTLGLPFLCRMDSFGQYVWEDHWPRSGVWKGTSGGEAISFSGCDDDQTSADTSALSRITSTGAMTFCFIQAIESGQATTYGSVLNSMRTTIRNAGDSMGRGGAVTSLIIMLLTGGSVTTGGLRQEPQLTSSDPFDVYAKPFSL